MESSKAHSISLSALRLQLLSHCAVSFTYNSVFIVCLFPSSLPFSVSLSVLMCFSVLVSFIVVSSAILFSPRRAFPAGLLYAYNRLSLIRFRSWIAGVLKLPFSAAWLYDITLCVQGGRIKKVSYCSLYISFLNIDRFLQFFHR